MILQRIPSSRRIAELGVGMDQSVYFMTVLQETIASRRRILADNFVANTIPRAVEDGTFV